MLYLKGPLIEYVTQQTNSISQQSTHNPNTTDITETVLPQIFPTCATLPASHIRYVRAELAVGQDCMCLAGQSGSIIKLIPANKRIRTMYKPYTHFSMQKPYASLNLANKFPEDIECIVSSADPSKGSLFISNIEAAENLNTLKKHRITAVMSCAKGYQLRHPAQAVPHYKYIPTLDKDQCDISIHFDEAADFITKHIAHTNVLVHCIAGVSRSVSMVIAYFIREHNMTYQQAYNLVKSKRKIIHPNDGFIRQLKQYESKAKTEEKKRDTSPANYKYTPASTKRSTYGPTHDYPQFKSSTFIPDTTDPKKPQRIAEAYKSYELTPKKADYRQQYAQKENAQHNQGIYRTSTAFFTPNKTSYARNLPEQKLDQANTKTQNVNRYPVAQKTLNAETANDQRKISPNKAIQGQASHPKPAEGPRKHQFEQMNRQLNQKIELIRQKYENERKKLYERYQTGGKSYQNYNNTKKNTTAVDPQPEYRYAATQERKRVSLTVDRLNQRNDDFVRSTTIRETNPAAFTRDFTQKPQIKDRTAFGYDGVEDIYSKKFENIYTSSKGYQNDYTLQGGRGLAGKGYSHYLGYNFDYSYRRY